MGRFLEDEEKDRMVRLYQDGKSIKEIAEIVGRAGSTVNYTLKNSEEINMPKKYRVDDEYLLELEPRKYRFRSVPIYDKRTGKTYHDITPIKYPNGDSVFGVEYNGPTNKLFFEEIDK